MSVTIEMSDQELAKLKLYTRRDNDSEAIVAAAREFLRHRSLRELKGASGNVEFELNWEQLEELELKESCPPV